LRSQRLSEPDQELTRPEALEVVAPRFRVGPQAAELRDDIRLRKNLVAARELGALRRVLVVRVAGAGARARLDQDRHAGLLQNFTGAGRDRYAPLARETFPGHSYHIAHVG